MSEQDLIVVVGGSDVNRQLVIGKVSFGMEGINDSRKLLEAAGYNFRYFIVTPNLLKKRVGIPLDQYRLLFNVITDADKNPRVLDVLRHLLKKSGVRVVNHPAKIQLTTREKIAQRLNDVQGISVPRTLRLARRDWKRVSELVERSGFRFPAILRPAGAHGGEGARTVRNMNALLARRERRTDSYLTEFTDYKSDDGYYRKYRCFFIGDSIVFRHLIVSDNWSIHARDREKFMMKKATLVKEEEELHAAGYGSFTASQQNTLQTIRGLIGLDYFGIDFALVPSGRLLLFEANATMNFFPFFSDEKSHYSRQCLPIAVAAMRRLVEHQLTA